MNLALPAPGSNGEAVGPEEVKVEIDNKKKEKVKCCKCYIVLTDKIRVLIEKVSFSIAIVVLIMINTLIMAIDHKGMSENLS